MKVMKFGGSSVATPERIRTVVGILRQARGAGEVAVVVSALGGVTDELIAAAKTAAAGDSAYVEGLDRLVSRHLAAVRELADPSEAAAVERQVEAKLGDLRDLLHGTYLVREASLRTLDSVMSYGERLSSMIVAAALRRAGTPAEALDARRLIVTDGEFGAARVDVAATNARVAGHFVPGQRIQVVTGFIAATPDGETTTLGRGGSDYTASLLGAALGAECVELWTDVDGVMSADPRIVPSAEPIAELSYDELMELSHFGAKVVHPPSVHPTRAAGVPLWIKNTLSPAFRGTRVLSAVQAGGERPVCGIASIRRVALLRLEGDGMVGVPGIAKRLFGALAERRVSVILISQASSEHSICFSIAPGDVAAARRGIAEEFDLEQKAGLIDPLVVEEEMSVVAAVGAGMQHRPGIAGRLFGVLARLGVNVRAISQGSSELNISLVVEAGDEARAVGGIHDAFLFPRRREVELTVVGTGRVGAALLRQLAGRRAALEEETGLRVRLRAVAGRSRALVDDLGLDDHRVVERLAAEGRPYVLDDLVAAACAGRAVSRVFVDCTASEEVTRFYEPLLTAGVHVVAANKLRLAGGLAGYKRLMASGPGRLYYETTVGAGLPVVGTLVSLRATGDRIRSIEGVLSGTLAFLTDQLGDGVRLSDAVRRAHELGYTEPDPREDLTGVDVARKLLILGRLAGRDLDESDVAVESLLPDESWYETGLDAFWERLAELDDAFAARQEAARREGKQLCYLAALDEDGARVSLEAVDPGHPAASLRGTDNLIAVYTDRYDETPLVIRGPGAGPEVTAAGVFGDVLRAARES